MEIDKLKDIVENFKDKSNKDLLEATNFLKEEFENVKKYIVDLTHHMDTVENIYENILKELENRTKL